MNTQEFLKISFILDKYGLLKEADHLTAIAQNTSITDLQKRIDYYTKKIEAYNKNNLKTNQLCNMCIGSR
jgi:hypothetical protein